MKKLLTSLLMTALVLTTTVVSFAEIQEGAEARDLATADSFYQERGQINLDELDFYLNNGDLNIKGDNSLDKKRISQELSNSENLTKEIKAMVKAGDEPVAVGYTRVYLKEIQDEEGNTHVEPITVAEASTELEGDKSKRGNLTLYTTAFATNSGITVKSVAQWSLKYQLSGENRPAEYDDYISASTSNKYILNSDTFKATMTNGVNLASKFYSRKKAGTASAVYAFSDMKPDFFQIKDATLTIHCGKNGTLPKTVKCKSGYVHTWGKTDISISIGKEGPVFTFETGSKSWQIASFVNCPSK